MYKDNLIKVWENDDYRISMEECCGYVFLHCRVKNWSKSTLKKLVGMRPEVLKWSYENGFDGFYAYTHNSKMARMIPGAKKVSEFVSSGTGLHLEVFKWSR